MLEKDLPRGLRRVDTYSIVGDNGRGSVVLLELVRRKLEDCRKGCTLRHLEHAERQLRVARQNDLELHFALPHRPPLSPLSLSPSSAAARRVRGTRALATRPLGLLPAPPLQARSSHPSAGGADASTAATSRWPADRRQRGSRRGGGATQAGAAFASAQLCACHVLPVLPAHHALVGLQLGAAHDPRLEPVGRPSLYRLLRARGTAPRAVVAHASQLLLHGRSAPLDFLLAPDLPPVGVHAHPRACAVRVGAWRLCAHDPAQHRLPARAQADGALAHVFGHTARHGLHVRLLT
mmetsp:Transcript_2306/g.6329  ORF Transcript_2306/g.6329 Transcript_2306/m.6329 type:complete len:293 (+) Transcript_2306:491-1369(+)